MATLALNSGLRVRRLLIGGSILQGRYPDSEVNDAPSPGKPDHLRGSELGCWIIAFDASLGLHASTNGILPNAGIVLTSLTLSGVRLI